MRLYQLESAAVLSGRKWKGKIKLKKLLEMFLAKDQRDLSVRGEEVSTLSSCMWIPAEVKAVSQMEGSVSMAETVRPLVRVESQEQPPIDGSGEAVVHCRPPYPRH